MVRPPKPANEVRSQVLQLRLTIDERASLEAGAERAGEQLSQFIRNAALEKAASVAPKRESAKTSRKS